MFIKEYLKQVKHRFSAGISTEHSYRGDLQNLLQSLVKGIDVTNEPKRQKCGAPDYIIQRKEVPLGYIEAKDVGDDLNKTEKSKQLKRYLSSLNNLILTDYLEFRFYRYGEKVKEIQIASIENGDLKTKPENFESLITHITDFCSFKGQTIKSSEKLARMMAQKSRMMEEVIYNAVMEEDDNSTLRDQLDAFRRILIHDLDEKTFADIYAQTITYGLFAARLHDETLEDFSRQEARELIPRSNPFLRNLFDYVSGVQLDERVVWIVDDLADIFRATDLNELLADFGKSTEQNDPFLHFYETFLGEYDPKLRKSRGVYYTPEPVVNFIVRAVDDILKSEFGIVHGLADTSKMTIEVDEAVLDKRRTSGHKKVKRQVHKVQILDPATGTGTFLAEVVKHIYKKFEGQKGIWSNYVENELLPRLNGFEILMAPFAMCHLKLEMLLKETGYKPKDKSKEKRLRVFLTNSLEEHDPDTGTLFASWLSKEATEANYVKRDTPVMVVIGNPPYSVSSSNKSEWIQNLLKDYKKDLNERKINLDDDYIKFIRYGQYYIDKNWEGILAYISNNSFIDGITHRQMRKHLLQSFDKVYILDLHGNAKKKEVCPDGSVDQNVFDIMQGVSINIFVKTGQKKKNELGKIYHSEIFGKRDLKYSFLNDNMFNTINWVKLYFKKPNYFFVPRNYDKEDKYNKGFRINDFFINQNSGIQTKNDFLTINIDKEKLKSVVSDFQQLDEQELKGKFNLKDTSGWTAKKAKEDIIQNTGNYYPIYYRPFDVRYIYMTEKSGGFVGRPRLSTMKHFFGGNNYGLITVRQQSTFDFQHILISNTLMESGAISLQTKEWGYIFPLYQYPDQEDGIFKEKTRKPNLNLEIVEQIAKKLSLEFTNEKEDTENTFAPIDILDYIYAVLHSPTYRDKYKEFLKIDFPRVPYPKNKETFWQLVKLGGELRQIHLLESPKVEQYITTYPQDGDNIITRKLTKTNIGYENTDEGMGRVWINDTQYFDKVPLVAWEFYIGGYQPAQKWLKDRKGRELNFEDILHYQKIIVALTETDRIMKEIKNVVIQK